MRKYIFHLHQGETYFPIIIYSTNYERAEVLAHSLWPTQTIFYQYNTFIV